MHPEDSLGYSRGVLFNEALRLLGLELSFLDYEFAAEAGPYKQAAPILASFVQRRCGRVQKLLDFADGFKLPRSIDSARAIEMRATVVSVLRKLMGRVVPMLRTRTLSEAEARKRIRAAARRVTSAGDKVRDVLERGRGRFPLEETAANMVIVVLDLARYSLLARLIDRAAGAKAVRELNVKIQSLINGALGDIGTIPADTVLATLGDGAILVFDTPNVAHRFACRLHHRAREHNSLIPDDQHGHYSFRIGVYNGEIVLRQELTAGGEPAAVTMAGIAIANAVRLQARSRTNGILMAEHTWSKLPKKLRGLYGPVESIEGKHPGEVLWARRHQGHTPAAWDVADDGRAATTLRRERRPKLEFIAARRSKPLAKRR